MSAGRAREGFVDALRGFALLGIVLVNVPFLAISPEGYTAASLAAPLDAMAGFVTVAFAQAKFYLLFAFLFGYSLGFLLDRDDAPQRRRFRRRLLGLAVLGALHAVFAFIGDILLLYALIGSSMLVMARWRDAVLLRFAAIVLVAWWALLALLAFAVADMGDSGSGPFSGLADALAQGGFVDASLARLAAWPEAFTFIAVVNGPAVWAMFAIGRVAGRRCVFADAGAHLEAWRRAAWIGAALGLPPALWSAGVFVAQGGGANEPIALSAALIGFATAPFLSLAYVATLVLVDQRWPSALAVFQPAGRMSLTGYLGESIVLSLLFCGYGGALFGTVGAAAALAVAVVTWAVLDLFARGWSARFGQGPFERVLRRISG